MEKLIALVPPPRVNLTRYHGVLAPRSSLRKKVVQKTKEGVKREKKYNLGWAKLMRRVWGVEVDKCMCGGKPAMNRFAIEYGERFDS